MSTKQRVGDGVFRAKLMFGSLLLGAFLGVVTCIFWLSDWRDMDLLQLARAGWYVYQRDAGILGLAAFGGAFTIGWPVWMFAWRPLAARPGEASDGEHVRGQSLTTAADVAKLVKKGGQKTRLTIGSVPIPVGVEDLNFLLAGSPSTGKSQSIRIILDTLHADRHRVIIPDPSGIFYSLYASPDAILFNPYDRRSVSWSPLADISDPKECKAMARSLVPDGHGESAQWHKYAQEVLDAVLRHVWSADGTTGEFLRLATYASPDELRELLPPGPVMALLDEGSAKMFSNVRSIIGTYLQPFDVLDPAGGRRSFSFRDAITKGDGDGWIFIPYEQTELDALAPLISAVLDVLARAVLRLPPAKGDRSKQKRTWFILDELPLLGRISSLQTLLTNGSKHGSVVIAGIQAISQLREVYGRDHAETLFSALGTWLVLRVNSGEMAAHMAKELGEAEVRRISHGGGKSDGGKSESWSEQYQIRPLVLGSEIKNLDALDGYLNIAGKFPVCRVRLPVAPARQEVAAPFEAAPLRSAVPVAALVLADDDEDTADTTTINTDDTPDDAVTSDADTPFGLER